MSRAHFSFKDYKLLYNAKIIENYYYNDETDPDYWPQFLEQPGMKPLVVLRYLYRESINTLVDHLFKAFSSAEKLELKKGLPTGYQNKYFNGYFNYTLERSRI
ncbi:hypothetical protein Ddc_19541 [Ditylenchus destructor]|nr:hypothetical protein Ddc_19541 [Ditylenchus destructor]